MIPVEHHGILIPLIQQYGYIVVFFGTLFEGETISVLGGFVAYLGDLNLFYLYPIAIIGATLGDQMFFWIGRMKGKGFLLRHQRWNLQVSRVHKLLDKHQNWMIAGSRFMYGFRIAIPLAFGTSEVSALKYLILDFLGATIWGAIFISSGYIFGNAVEKLLGHVKRLRLEAIIVIILVFVIIQLYSWYKRRKQDKAEGIV